MISAKIDTNGAFLALDSLRDAMVGKGMDASNIVRDEARLLARTIASFTPPPKGNAKKVGEDAIEKDLKSLIAEASYELIDEIGSKFGTRNIQNAYITKKDGTQVELNWENLDYTGSGLDDLHKKYRNQDGRVPRLHKSRANVWKSRVVVPEGVRAPFIKKIQQRVGRAKAAWAFTAYKLGGSVPGWISRHFGSLGSTSISSTEGLSDTIKPSVLFGSRAPGVRKMQSQIQAAVRVRTKAIARKVKLILSDYNSDLARGMRAQTKAAKYKEAEPSVE
jgi:hypothetical protein